MWLNSTWLSKKDLKKLEKTLKGAFRSPVPTQMMTNGEFMPLAQTRAQREVEERLKRMADTYGKKLGLSRRQFLQTSCGMAAAFLAMNEVFGPFFRVDPAEAADPAAAAERLASLADEFILDAQTHHVHDNYAWEGILFLTQYAQGRNPQKKAWDPKLGTKPPTLDWLKFDQYIKHIFLDSDTKVAILSGFTSETPQNMALTSDQIVESRNIFNKLTGSQRMMAHGLFWPGRPGNLDEMDRVAQGLKIDSWKGYTVGDPLYGESKYPWMMDDEKMTFPCWEKAEKVGVRNVCIHKGLMPPDYQASFQNWRYAKVDDVGGAAKAFPNLNFIIYHSAIRPLLDVEEAAAEFEKTGYIPWVTDLTQIPKKYGVNNVYAELGTVFASTVITHPRLAAAILGQFIQHMGVDHVIWGTDSIWYGTPQWQIEAFRRFQIPEALAEKHGYAPLTRPVKEQ
ncbi:MAG: amidohydrolase family protein, partial [candidate division NC10 bacterium]|nr:amidohydrolase family protein [candidate division NC10 bacterium]